MPVATSKDTKFWDKTAARYAKQPVADEATYQKKLEIKRKYLTPQSEVFEFGCGTGSTAILHAPHVHSILATDVAENMLAVGRERAAEAGVGNVSFQRTGIEDYDPAGRQFDVVLALNIIHLCREPLAVMQKVNTLLKPGGYFIQSTVCLKEAMPVAQLIVPVLQLVGKAPHVTFLKRAGLDAMIAEAGFEVVETYRPDKKMAAEFIVSQKAG